MKFQLKESKWLYVLLSILLATVFWLFVRRVEDPPQDATIRNIPVTLAGERVLEDQGMTVKSVSRENVSLKINAPLSAINRMRDNMTVTLDVSKCSTPGEYQLSYVINYPPNVTQSEVTLIERLPSEITVTIDRLASNVFEIQPRFDGSIAQGYQAGTWAISQETVTISGAADQVDQIASVEAVLEGEELTERLSADVPLTLLDKDGNVLTDLDVKMSIDTVYVTLPIVVVKTIPLTVNFISGGGVNAEDDQDYSFITFPETITVSGEKEDIEALNEISLGSVDLAKVMGTSSFPFSIDLDARFENVSGITQATVTVSVSSALATKTLNVDNIELINPPEGRTASKVTQMCAVVIRGQEEDLELVDASQINIVADLSNVTSVGSCTVPVKVYLNASKNVGVIGEYNIVVNIS